MEEISNALTTACPKIMIVRDDIRVRRIRFDLLRSGNPGIELVGGVEMVISLAHIGFARKPVPVIAAMKPHITDGRCHVGGGPNRSMK